METRPLEKSDDIKDLVMSLLGDVDAGKVADELVLSFLHDDHYHAFGTKQGDHSAAFAAMKCDPFEGANEVGEIVFLAVEPSQRKKHLGRDLVRFVENYAGKQGIRKLYVITGVDNIGAVCFWIQQGYSFEARMRDFTLPGIDNYYMGKTIRCCGTAVGRYGPLR